MVVSHWQYEIEQQDMLLITTHGVTGKILHQLENWLNGRQQEGKREDEGKSYKRKKTITNAKRRHQQVLCGLKEGS